MPVLLHQQPVLTLALDSFQDTTIDENDIRRMWILFTKCKDDIKNGFRLENISWRIWYKKYLNNTSDLFSSGKLYKDDSIDHSLVHSVESNCSSYSTIEPIEVLKKCACGEQLISSSLNSLSTPHSEYTCFNKFSCHHHHQSPQKQPNLIDTIPQKELSKKNESLDSSQNTLIQSSVLREETTLLPKKEEVVVIKEEEPEQKVQEEEKMDDEVEVEQEKDTSSVTDDKEKASSTQEIPKEIQQSSEKIPEEAVDATSIPSHTMTNPSNSTKVCQPNTTGTDGHSNTTNGFVNHTQAAIPPNCLTLEQFYQQQLLILQQMYIQKQQQLQYQKQQMNVNNEQVVQQQIYLQQWYNQQQQKLLSNCTLYYKKYLQQLIQSNAQAQAQAQVQAQSQSQSQTQPQVQAKGLMKESSSYIEDDEDYDDEDEEDDDFYYSDEDDEDDYNYNDDNDDDQVTQQQKEIPTAPVTSEEKEKMMVGEIVPKKVQSALKDDLFRKLSTPSLKNKVTKPSLLSAMIKENNYNEYKKTVEIIQRYNEDVQEVSNNIYSIKDYNRNCINSLNKNIRRKRAPSFEDVRNAQQGYRRLYEMQPLHPGSQTHNNNNCNYNQLQESNHQEMINSDIEEYYERNPHSTTSGYVMNNSYSTVNSQDSHTTLYSTHHTNQNNGIYGSNKTTHSTKSTRSTKSFFSSRPATTTNNNNSINVYLNNRKRLNYSN